MKKLIELRNKLGLSQRALGEMLGVSHSAIRQYETRLRKPNSIMATVLIKLALENGFKMDYNDIYDDEGLIAA